MNEKKPRYGERSPILPTRSYAQTSRSRPSLSPRSATAGLVTTLLLLSIIRYIQRPYSTFLPGFLKSSRQRNQYSVGSFYANVKTQEDLCPLGGDRLGSAKTRKTAKSGYIGLKGDIPEEGTPRRSFFWLFEAQNDPENAPLVLTHGGGPGSSGLMNPMLGQSHCVMRANGSLEHNPNAWSEQYNLLALDHPLGVGFSYGFPPNSAQTAAVDVYDFLQKFYAMFPHLAKNKLILASGSYGGMYVPHTATEIHTQNLALAAGTGEPGAIHIPLEAMMVSNPLSDTLSHFRWLLDNRCQNPIHNVYNATQCAEAYVHLPECLDALQYALDFPSADGRKGALMTCRKAGPDIDQNGVGRMLENVKIKCDGSLEGCVPEMVAVGKYLNANETREMLGVPDSVPDWVPVNKTVWQRFFDEGDMVQRAHLLYGPLVSSGIRLLHYVGALDANCGWPGIYHFLKYIRTPFQSAFLNATDVEWHPNATVRAVGDHTGAGNFTWVLLSEAGHFVTENQPELVKRILETWVEDRAWI